MRTLQPLSFVLPWFVFPLLLAGCRAEPDATVDRPGETAADVDASYAAELEAWQRERDAGLAGPDSWLTLAGLSWFVSGENVAGSDLAYDIPMPESVPARLGTFYFRPEGAEGQKVELIVEDGLRVQVAGEPVDRTFLRLDVEGDPTIVEIGTVTVLAIQRGEQVGLRVRDRESASLAEFDGVPRYPADESWRVAGRFEPYDPPKPVGVPTVLGTTVDLESPGRVVFERDGEPGALDALPAGGDQVWLIFADATNADSTYGSGRFLYADIAPDVLKAGGELIVDFNLAYNPPCAFSSYATCPLPPAGNRLSFRVEAGEQRYRAAVH
ncbi:MAG: DUF1684 domain-containing protein [Acidobacteriota bacterium]